MLISIIKEELFQLISRQLNNLFGLDASESFCIQQLLPIVLDRVEVNFAQNPNKYYARDGQTYFNPFHSGQWCVFLYYLSNTIWKQGNSMLADKVYYLNKALNGCDLFYEIELPSDFRLDHPVGTVLGRAQYGNGFTFGQNCTVGNNHGIYPIIGNNVELCANASILGNCHIGDNVIVGAYACVKDQDVPSNSIVFGQSPNLIIKKRHDI